MILILHSCLDQNTIFVISNASERVCEYRLPKLKVHLIVILSPVQLINWKFFKQFNTIHYKRIVQLIQFVNLWFPTFCPVIIKWVFKSLSNGFLILVLPWTTVYYTDVPTLYLAPSFIMSLNLKNFPLMCLKFKYILILHWVEYFYLTHSL